MPKLRGICLGCDFLWFWAILNLTNDKSSKKLGRKVHNSLPLPPPFWHLTPNLVPKKWWWESHHVDRQPVWALKSLETASKRARMRLKNIPLDRESKSSFFFPHTGGTNGSPVPPSCIGTREIGKLAGISEILGEIESFDIGFAWFLFWFFTLGPCHVIFSMHTLQWCYATSAMTALLRGCAGRVSFYVPADVAPIMCHVSMVPVQITPQPYKAFNFAHVGKNLR